MESLYETLLHLNEFPVLPRIERPTIPPSVVAASPRHVDVEGEMSIALRKAESNALLAFSIDDRADSYLFTATARIEQMTPLYRAGLKEEFYFGREAGHLVYFRFPSLLESITDKLQEIFVLPGKRPFRYVKSHTASPYLPKCYRPIGPWSRIPPDDDLDPTCKAELVLRKQSARDAPFLDLVADFLTSRPVNAGDWHHLRIPLPNE